MIRETLLDSHRYALLSTEAKLFYIHLLLLADDLGCVSVSETFLRRRAFHDAPSGSKIAVLLTELVDADLVRTYEADRACFAFIPRFRQRLQRVNLKHPKPPASLYADDDYATDLFNKIKSNSSTSTVGQPVSNGDPTVIQPPEVKRREEVHTADAVSVSKGRPKTLIPKDFEVSQRVRAWATERQFGNLDAHLEHFVGYVVANGKKYSDWDVALMNAIRDNWAKVSEAKPKRPVW